MEGSHVRKGCREGGARWTESTVVPFRKSRVDQRRLVRGARGELIQRKARREKGAKDRSPPMSHWGRARHTQPQLYLHPFACRWSGDTLGLTFVRSESYAPEGSSPKCNAQLEVVLTDDSFNRRLMIEEAGGGVGVGAAGE